MILSRDYTRLRLAALPDNVIEKLLAQYQVSKEDLTPLTAQDVKEIEETFQKHIPGKEDLLTQWFMLALKQNRAYFPSSLVTYIDMAQWFFAHQKEPLFRELAQKRADWVNKPLNPKNILHFNGYDINTIRQKYKEAEEAAKVNKFPDELPEGSELIYSDGSYRILEVTDPPAACALGQGTDWCTGKYDTAEDYLNDAPLYVFYRGDDKVAQLHMGNPEEGDAYNIQLKNVKNRTMKVTTEIQRVLIKSGFMAKILKLAAQTYGSEKVLDTFVGERPNREIEALCVGDPKLAYYYADNVLHRRFQAGEDAIAQNFYMAMDYARKYMHGRFVEAEPNIINRAKGYALQYSAMLHDVNPQQYEEFIKEYPEMAIDFGEPQAK